MFSGIKTYLTAGGAMTAVQALVAGGAVSPEWGQVLTGFLTGLSLVFLRMAVAKK
jgi:hypothetical protein